MQSNRPDAAAAELRVALADDPRNVESLVNLALLQRAAGRVADARSLLRRALQIDPRSADRITTWPSWRTNRAIRRRPSSTTGRS